MMMKKAVAGGAALAAVIGAVPALAQTDPAQSRQQQRLQQGQQMSQQEFGRNEIASFFQAAERSINQAVQNGNEQAIQQWTQRHIANEATFVGIMESSSGSSSSAKSWAAVSASKQDLLRAQRAIFNLAPDVLNAIRDYDLTIRVRSVQPIGDNAALVKTRISESGSIGGLGQVTATGSGRQQLGDAGDFGQGSAAQGAGAGGDPSLQRSQRSSAQISFDASADCDHVVFRDQQSNTIQIGTTNCQGQSRMSVGR